MKISDSKFSIRRAIGGDEVAISKVHIQAWQEAYAGLLPNLFLQKLPESVERRVQNWKGAIDHFKRWVYVVEASEGIVGFACFQPARDLDRIDFGELSAIYLLKKYNKKGAGYAMLKAGFNQLKDEGFSKAYCWVLENNPTTKFYERTNAKFSGKIKDDIIGDQKVREFEYIWYGLEIG